MITDFPAVIICRHVQTSIGTYKSTNTYTYLYTNSSNCATRWLNIGQVENFTLSCNMTQFITGTNNAVLDRS